MLDRKWLVCAIIGMAGCGGAAGPSATGSGNPNSPSMPSPPSDTPTAPSPPDPGSGAPADMAGTNAPPDGGAPADGGTTPTGPINGTGTLTGTMNGYTVATVRSVFAVVTGTSFNVYFSDRENACAILQAGATPKDSSFLRFGSTAGAGPHTFPLGAYTYPSGGGSGTGGGTGGGGMGGGTGGSGNGMGTRGALIAAADDRCLLSGYDQAATGNFTIKAAVDPAATKSIEGSLDITFAVGAMMGEFKGTFTAPVCPNAKDIPLSPVACQ